MPDNLLLLIERGRSGAWFVSSPDDPRLQIAAATPEGALALVPKFMSDLAREAADRKR